ncbi:NAD-dependent glycerol-3-phosphate dehydrogenase family protein [Mycobacterium xenopi 3993]|nr:NAD-dependent glycerol-3-phosphate dehydrogenase family protein [Mycobacterium xenopi 3993]
MACSDSGRAVALQRALNTGYFRPYTNADVIGTEIGGACKNVIALACGMAAGAGLGENTAAAIITRGLPRSCGSGSHWEPRVPRSPAWPGWATWWPPAPHGGRATGLSASAWAGRHNAVGHAGA